MNTDLNWRDTALYPRFLMFDARSVIPVLLWAFHMKIWTGVLAICCVVIFGACEYFGITPDVGLRIVRVSCLGALRPVAQRYTYRRYARW